MSILSTIKDAVSTVTSTVSSSTSIKVYLAIGAMAVALAGGAWAYVHSLQSTIETQHDTIVSKGKTITKQEGDISTLKADRAEAVTQRDAAQARTATLNEENQKNAADLEKARQNAATLAGQLAAAQAGNACAKSAVPDAVKRLQRQAITDFNAEYGAKAGDQAGKTAAGGDVPAA